MLLPVTLPQGSLKRQTLRNAASDIPRPFTILDSDGEDSRAALAEPSSTSFRHFFQRASEAAAARVANFAPSPSANSIISCQASG